MVNSVKKVWKLDEQTLIEAWNLFNASTRTDPFGAWFLERYYIPGIVAWPALSGLTDDMSAYSMLHQFCCED